METHKSKGINRKAFLRTACLAGSCFCGFVPNAYSSANEGSGDENIKLMQDWISNLLLSMDDNTTEEDCRKMMKPCAIAHYNSLGMDKVLAPYIGDIKGFNDFISNKWGWIIDYDSSTGILTANENKSYCVCPLVNQNDRNKLPVLCYCSEGFAEKMFSEVVGYPVAARVVASVQRGDKHCIYEIRLKEH